MGVVYRPPNTNHVAFIDELNVILEKIKRENKICYILGDFNYNLLRAEDHIPTSNLLDWMYSYSFLPLINRPTRVTRSTATLID